MSCLGVDVSGNQTLAQITSAAADPANTFVIVKATQGLAYVSSAWPKSREAAGAKYLGAYHYCEEGHDPIAEADHFLATAQLQSGQIAVLDLERPVTPAFVVAWLDRVKEKSSAVPLVYSNWKWIPPLRTAATPEQWARITSYPLWLAENGAPGEHSTVKSQDGTSQDCWPIVMHQYGVIDGLDRDYTPDIDGLRKLAKP